MPGRVRRLRCSERLRGPGRQTGRCACVAGGACSEGHARGEEGLRLRRPRGAQPRASVGPCTPGLVLARQTPQAQALPSSTQHSQLLRPGSLDASTPCCQQGPCSSPACMLSCSPACMLPCASGVVQAWGRVQARAFFPLLFSNSQGELKARSSTFVARPEGKPLSTGVARHGGA